MGMFLIPKWYHIELLNRLVSGDALIRISKPSGKRFHWEVHSSNGIWYGSSLSAKWLYKHGFIRPTVRLDAVRAVFEITQAGIDLLNANRDLLKDESDQLLEPHQPTYKRHGLHDVHPR